MRLQNFIRQRLHFLAFPFLFGRAFIEAGFIPEGESGGGFISLPSWKGFH